MQYGILRMQKLNKSEIHLVNLCSSFCVLSLAFTLTFTFWSFCHCNSLLSVCLRKCVRLTFSICFFVQVLKKLGYCIFKGLKHQRNVHWSHSKLWYILLTVFNSPHPLLEKKSFETTTWTKNNRKCHWHKGLPLSIILISSVVSSSSIVSLFTQLTSNSVLTQSSKDNIVSFSRTKYILCRSSCLQRFESFSPP